ncbi:MAG: 3-deoxy-7-phosphoheptulonate synthase [Polyangiaceae bacterium]|nr:3-deoxy-7-phosphoheptulonate synthase [Polyangiaceae bacterium]
MFSRVDDVRIESLRPLIPPAILMEELPLDDEQTHLVATSRDEIGAVLTGADPRFLVVIGPCSIHDPEAGLEYAERLKAMAAAWHGELLVVMRTYVEKPRTTVGWKGLINDPDLNGKFAINKGLRLARGFLRDVVSLGLPTGTEFLDPIGPQFIADLVCWGAIGARTTESQVHRELASGLSMPVGFKNGTDGDVQIAVDAIHAALSAHHFLSVTKQGLAAIVATQGNPLCHVILRGGRSGPNCSAEQVSETARRLEQAGLRPRLMIDCSHANSGRDPVRQAALAAQIADRIAQGDGQVFGVMLESFLVEGRQELGSEQLCYGQSITDPCMGWERTVEVIERLGEAVAARIRSRGG